MRIWGILIANTLRRFFPFWRILPGLMRMVMWWAAYTLVPQFMSTTPPWLPLVYWLALLMIVREFWLISLRSLLLTGVAWAGFGALSLLNQPEQASKVLLLAVVGTVIYGLGCLLPRLPVGLGLPLRLMRWIR